MLDAYGLFCFVIHVGGMLELFEVSVKNNFKILAEFFLDFIFAARI